MKSLIVGLMICVLIGVSSGMKSDSRIISETVVCNEIITVTSDSLYLTKSALRTVELLDKLIEENK